MTVAKRSRNLLDEIEQAALRRPAGQERHKLEAAFPRWHPRGATLPGRALPWLLRLAGQARGAEHHRATDQSAYRDHDRRQAPRASSRCSPAPLHDLEDAGGEIARPIFRGLGYADRVAFRRALRTRRSPHPLPTQEMACPPLSCRMWRGWLRPCHANLRPPWHLPPN